MIKIDKISKTFRWKKDATQALKNVSLTIEDGEIYGIIGFSGAGKSTLVRMINGLEKPDSGTVFLNDTDIGSVSNKELRKIRKGIGMVFQQFNLLESRTVYENIAMPLILNKVDKGIIRKKVTQLLTFVELDDKADVYPSQLSGGQKQRVGIARALANDPKLLLCDEATSALDPRTTDSILDLLQRINEELGITIVIITHEMHVIQKICHKVAVMENGSVVEDGPVQDVFTRPRAEITKGFVDMIVREDIPVEVRKLISKERGISQVWSIKYWGENKTLPMIENLKKEIAVPIRILYTTTSVLRNYVLNIVVVSVDCEDDQGEIISRVIEPYEALLERKNYEF